MIKKTVFWSREGIITLIATLIGVFLALYLNEWNASRKLKKQKEIATENILTEISANKKLLTESVKNYTEMLDIYIFFNECLSAESEFITSSENMIQFRTKHPGLLSPIDSVRLENGMFKYTRMNLNLVFTLEQVELRTIAWETLKSSNIISSYDFDYLMSLEYIYKSLYSIIQTNNGIYNDAKKFIQGDMSVLDNLIFNVKMAINTENGLIDLCNKDYGK
ncbi:hypothetical protein ACE01N_04330 [Saccharicrinis sp. FJH2]|uniref:hypothetical protein n=1 Tax=Saccharicrinis sp. FJH65 TaxID=3344659 RepID=UPI0035F4496A